MFIIMLRIIVECLFLFWQYFISDTIPCVVSSGSLTVVKRSMPHMCRCEHGGRCTRSREQILCNCVKGQFNWRCHFVAVYLQHLLFAWFMHIVVARFWCYFVYMCNSFTKFFSKQCILCLQMPSISSELISK